VGFSNRLLQYATLHPTCQSANNGRPLRTWQRARGDFTVRQRFLEVQAGAKGRFYCGAVRDGRGGTIWPLRDCENRRRELGGPAKTLLRTLVAIPNPSCWASRRVATQLLVDIGNVRCARV
jgi:hypothetical protein